MNKNSGQNVYFVGIGGVGMSSLAQLYHSLGWKVSGSDAARSIITDDLKNKGIKVFIGENRSRHISSKTDLLIHSAAINEDHPERVRARDLGIDQVAYSKALGEFTKQYKTIAVSGTHGKSTTTAIMSLILMEAGWDPTIIVGTRMRELGDNNFRKGESEWMIVEADEYSRAFLNYHPYAAICTNIDRDHLDYYKTFAQIKSAFKKFFANVDKKGLLVFNKENEILSEDFAPADKKPVFYSTKTTRAKEVKKLLKVPGQHNLSNAMACDTLASKLGINKEVRDAALSKFKGTWRRFEHRGQVNGTEVYDDYAHHPIEISATLQGTRELHTNKKVWAIFQPHLTQRLELLFKDFIRSFNEADQVIILETYKVRGRENKKGVNDAESLARNISKLKPCEYFSTQKELVSFLKKVLSPKDVAVLMGAGDITEVADKLVK